MGRRIIWKRRFKRISAVVVCMLIIVTGCETNKQSDPIENVKQSKQSEQSQNVNTNTEDYSQYEAHFISIIQAKDSEFQEYKRMRSQEDQDVYRMYQLNEEEYYFIVNTYGYEEDMLIGATLTSSEILKVEVLYENESKDYGDYVVEDWFLSRFQLNYQGSLELVKRKKTKENEVIAITGATITSQAVVNAINKCIMKVEG